MLHRKKRKQKSQGGCHLGAAGKGTAKVWVVCGQDMREVGRSQMKGLMGHIKESENTDLP